MLILSDTIIEQQLGMIIITDIGTGTLQSIISFLQNSGETILVSLKLKYILIKRWLYCFANCIDSILSSWYKKSYNKNFVGNTRGSFSPLFY